MSLPKSIVPAESVQLTGGEVKIRGLSVAEMRHVQMIKDETEADVVFIHYATGEDEADVRAWVGTALAGDLQTLVRAIAGLSKLGQDATFPGAAGHDVGAPRTS